MKRRTIGWIVVPVVLLAAVVLGGYVSIRRANHRSRIEAAKVWARLDEFPESATSVSVETRGGPFTREFTITFRAPLVDINAWIDTSPGTANVTPVVSDGKRQYSITPGGGAMHAELQVDDDQGTVRVHTFWS